MWSFGAAGRRPTTRDDGEAARWTTGPVWQMLGPMPMEVTVIPERHVKLLKNGRNQAVRIPRAFELPGEEAVMRKEGDRLIIEPARLKSLLAVLATLRPLGEAFPPISELPVDSVEL